MKQLERSRTRMRVSAKAPDWRARMGFPARLVWLMYSKLRKAPGVSTAMSFSRSSRVSRRRRPCKRDWRHTTIISIHFPLRKLEVSHLEEGVFYLGDTVVG